MGNFKKIGYIIVLMIILITLSSCKKCKDEEFIHESQLEKMVLENKEDFEHNINTLPNVRLGNSPKLIYLKQEDFTDELKSKVYSNFKNKSEGVLSVCCITIDGEVVPFGYEFRVKTQAISILNEKNSVASSYYIKDNILFSNEFITYVFLKEYIIEGDHCISLDKTKYIRYLGSEKIVYIPRGIVEILPLAFSLDHNIETVFCNDELYKIDMYAFFQAINLKKIHFNEKLFEIEYQAFTACSSLEEIIIPDSVEKIGDSAFGYCKKLKKITIPISIRTLGQYLFYECENNLIVYIKDEYRDKLPWPEISFYINVDGTMCRIAYLESED